MTQVHGAERDRSGLREGARADGRNHGSPLGSVDLRLPEHRRETFLDFYAFHLKHRAHPGAVYFLMPYLRERLGWDEEEALWFAFLNGNTQNPVTSLILHRVAPVPEAASALIAFWSENYKRLAWDTDRRYHKKNLALAVEGYLGAVRVRGGTQARYWEFLAHEGFWRVWEACSAIPSFGRLSAFSYAEYLRIMGVEFDCPTLFLEDMSGSRSHRNGLCIVSGLDHLDWHASNPGFEGRYSRDVLATLELEGASLLADARARARDCPWERDVSYFTLESALCTYKSWHRPNRRYPGVYLDMLHDRIRAAEAEWPELDFDIFWEAREACLPAPLRLEMTPGDPGVSPRKQNHYRETGETVVMGRDPEFERYHSTFDQDVADMKLGRFR